MRKPATATSSTVSSPTATTTITTTRSRRRLTGETVLLDPGHNGGNATHPDIISRLVNAGRGRTKPCNTPGTSTDSGYTEALFNFSVATDLRRLLLASGARVVMTRSNNSGVGPCVDERAAIGNRIHADAVLAIHADGGPSSGRGFHVIYPPPTGDTSTIYAASLTLARDVHRAVLTTHLLPESNYIGHDGYDQRDDLAGLNLSSRPAIFIELGNMRNARDAALQQTPSFRAAIAGALYRGLIKFFAAR